MKGLGDGYFGVCLCDAADEVRFVNVAFASVFFADLPDRPAHFAEALAHAIRSGGGIALDTMQLDTFVPRVKRRRREGTETYRFAVNLADGSWWWVNDYRLKSGWMLTIASEISTIKAEEDELRRAHAAAVHAAQTDFLTNLPNRRFGYERAEVALSAFKANRLPLSIALFDIDQFKRVNDLYGHEVGDRVLQLIAAYVAGEVRGQEQISRTGGEEFMLVMPEACLDRAEIRLRQLLLDIPALDMGERTPPLRVTVSIGLAAAHPSDTLATVVRRAEEALYRAKSNGRHRLERALPPTAGAEQGDAGAADERRHCVALLEAGHLANHYQPIVDPRSGRLLGLEVLGRLLDGGNLLSPAVFLPHFTHDDLGRLFHLSLSQALAFLAATSGLGETWLSLNIHPKTLSETGFVERLRETLARSGIAATRIVLEVLESEEFFDREDARKVLERLRALGFSIAIDDLGTGYSSLSRLRDLPIDKIKLDRSFIAFVAKQPESLNFIAAVQGLAHGLRKSFVVEGVESTEVLEALAILGVDSVQGYAIARPMAAATFQSWLAQYAPRNRADNPDSLLALYAMQMDALDMLTSLGKHGLPAALLPAIRDFQSSRIGRFLDHKKLHHTPVGLAFQEFQHSVLSDGAGPEAWEAISLKVFETLKQAMKDQAGERQWAA